MEPLQLQAAIPEAAIHEAAIHESQRIDQFTRQADPFIRRHAHSNNDLLQAMESL